ncbi:MAG: hypothetical protein IJ475_00460 [Bacilli bacterium]|nr:hypothetical protein [Bacilli bacterium]
MKEATGELNMTVITVVAIAAVGLIFTMFVWPNIQANLMMSTACSNMDMNGNYTANQTNGQNTNEGTVTCSNFQCTANYNGKTYTKDCNNA